MSDMQPDWTEQALHEAEWRAIYGRRIGYLRGEALAFRTKFRAARERRMAAKARADDLRDQLQALKGRRK